MKFSELTSGQKFINNSGDIFIKIPVVNSETFRGGNCILIETNDNRFHVGEPAWYSNDYDVDLLHDVPIREHLIFSTNGFLLCAKTNKSIRYPLISLDDLEYCPRCGCKLLHKNPNETEIC